MFKENSKRNHAKTVGNVSNNPYQGDYLLQVKSKSDITRLVDAITPNNNDYYWNKTEKTLLCSVIVFTKAFAKKDKKNLDSVVLFLRDMISDKYEKIEESAAYKNMVKFCKKNPKSFIAMNWSIFCLSGGKASKSIILNVLMHIKDYDGNLKIA